MLQEELNDVLSDMCEMANVKPRTTGLSTYIYVSHKQGNHGPRIKVVNSKKSWDNDNFSVSIGDEPLIVGGISKIGQENLDKVFNFIQLNKDLLLKFGMGL